MDVVEVPRYGTIVRDRVQTPQAGRTLINKVGAAALIFDTRYCSAADVDDVDVLESVYRTLVRRRTKRPERDCEPTAGRLATLATRGDDDGLPDSCGVSRCSPFLSAGGAQALCRPVDLTDMGGAFSADSERIPGPAWRHLVADQRHARARGSVGCSRLTVPEHLPGAFVSVITPGPLKGECGRTPSGDAASVPSISNILNFQQIGFLDDGVRIHRPTRSHWMGFNRSWKVGARRADDAHQTDVASTKRPASERQDAADRALHPTW